MSLKTLSVSLFLLTTKLQLLTARIGVQKDYEPGETGDEGSGEDISLDTFYEVKPGLIEKSALAVGFFDGVHPGHESVIKKAIEESRKLNVPSAVVTFRDHPRTLTQGKSPLLLTLLKQRLEHFDRLGLENALVLTFSEEICKLTPEQYVRTVLHECLGASSVSVGYNHRFGRNREGNPELLARLGNAMGFVVHVAPEVHIDGREVSSSRIRNEVMSGNLDTARSLLCRPYEITGKVVAGDGRGASIGFPTANLQVSQIQLLPKVGVYAAMTKLPCGSLLPSVVNLGYRPTMTDGDKLSLESHILDFQGDLYDSQLTVEFWHLLRNEVKFESIEALRKQIASDCREAPKFLPSNFGSANAGKALPA